MATAGALAASKADERACLSLSRRALARFGIGGSVASASGPLWCVYGWGAPRTHAHTRERRARAKEQGKKRGSSPRFFCRTRKNRGIGDARACALEPRNLPRQEVVPVEESPGRPPGGEGGARDDGGGRGEGERREYVRGLPLESSARRQGALKRRARGRQGSLLGFVCMCLACVACCQLCVSFVVGEVLGSAAARSFYSRAPPPLVHPPLGKTPTQAPSPPPPPPPPPPPAPSQDRAVSTQEVHTRGGYGGRPRGGGGTGPFFTSTGRDHHDHPCAAAPPPSPPHGRG
jgi:hypothetical protein